MIKLEILLLRNNYFSIFLVRVYYFFFFKRIVEFWIGYKRCYFKNNIFKRIWKIFLKYW